MLTYFGAVKPGLSKLVYSYKVIVKLKRTAAASRGFLAAARFSCFRYEKLWFSRSLSNQWQTTTIRNLHGVLYSQLRWTAGRLCQSISFGDVVYHGVGVGYVAVRTFGEREQLPQRHSKRPLAKHNHEVFTLLSLSIIYYIRFRVLHGENFLSSAPRTL